MEIKNIYFQALRIKLTTRFILYMLNVFEKPVCRYTNQANINNSISTYTNGVIYILYDTFQKMFMDMQVLYE